MERSELAILIPAFNEEENISNVINSVKSFGIPIVVDDGSEDKTALIAIKNGAELVSHKKNLGYESALNTGFYFTKGKKFKFILTIDADGQHNHETIPLLLQEVKNNPDIVITNRQKKQRFSEYLFSLYTNLRWGVKDPLSGLKLYSNKIYNELGYFDSFRSVGTELLIYALLHNKKIIQINTYTKDRNGESRYGGSFWANLKILRSLIISIYREISGKIM